MSRDVNIAVETRAIVESCSKFSKRAIVICGVYRKYQRKSGRRYYKKRQMVFFVKRGSVSGVTLAVTSS
jgi:hypothetical protein